MHAPPRPDLPAMDQDTFWLSPASYWLPAHYPVTAWATHAPFAAWLMDTLRPREIVELGTHFGFSCFAFAESAQRLGHGVRINALDSWQGDDHAGFYGEDVFEYVERTAASDYPESVRLVRGWFSDSRPQFEASSVDLLHIDGRHGYDDVVEDYTQWRDVVRDGGVVVFHDIAERERGFGVWRLWEELEATEPTFAFEHGHGLGVLGVGNVPEPLRRLFDADADTRSRIRSDYEHLGAAVARAQTLEEWAAEAESLRAQTAAARAEADVRSREAARLRTLLAATQGRVVALEDSTSWRVTAPLRAVTARLGRDR